MSIAIRTRLLTIDGWGHSYFEGGLSTCANEIVATYLIDLQLPTPGTVCPEDTPPFSERVTNKPAEATPVPLSDVIPQPEPSHGLECGSTVASS